MPWLGEARLSLSNEPRIGWLIMDGTTEYNRADYPRFVAKFSAASWFLAGSTSAKFKLLDVRDLNIAAGGKNLAVGAVVGNTEIKLTTAHMPEHDHDYNAPSSATDQRSLATGGLVGLLLTAIGLARPGATSPAKTGKAGAANPTPIQLMPRSATFYVYVFAGISGLRNQGAP